MFFAVVNKAIALTVPPVVVTLEAAGGGAVPASRPLVLAGAAELLAAADGPGCASTKAESGSPPRVSASAAFSAYATLNNNTRGCSACAEACTPSQRASPET